MQASADCHVSWQKLSLFLYFDYRQNCIGSERLRVIKCSFEYLQVFFEEVVLCQQTYVIHSSALGLNASVTA